MNNRYLLDSHVFLWWIYDFDRLGKKAYAAIETPNHQLYVSAATIWELTIKRHAGKLKAPVNMTEIILLKGFNPLSITPVQGERAGSLPDIHKDPFDRMLIAQAQLEKMTIITADKHIPDYDVSVLNAYD